MALTVPTTPACPRAGSAVRELARLAAAALGMLAGAAHAATPGVVVSVQPLHSLASAVMQGVGEPHLVVRGQGSPHTYRMRPSDARALAGARLVVWLGPSLETFLVAPLRSLPESAETLEASRAPGLVRYAARAGGTWVAPGDHVDDAAAARDGVPRQGHDLGEGAAPGDGDTGRHGHEAGSDPHLWLDPRNAAAIARAIAARLVALDPAGATVYRANLRGLVERLEALDAHLRARLEPVREVPYVVLHDAYQYLERRYALRAVGAVTVSPDRMPGARRVTELRRLVRALGVRCVFGEPQTDSPLLASVAEGAPVRTGVLDPLGAGYAPGPGAYFEMMEANGASLRDCLAE